MKLAIVSTFTSVYSSVLNTSKSDKLFALLILALLVSLKLFTFNISGLYDAFHYNWVASRIASGSLLYDTVWDHKPPGIYLIYLLNGLVGFSNVAPVVILLVIVSFFGALAFWRLAQEEFGISVKLSEVTTLVFVVITCIFFEGAIPNAENFFISLVLIGVWALFKSVHTPEILNYSNLLVAGLCFSAAGFIKYHALLESLILVVIVLFYKQLSSKQSMIIIGVIGGCMALPYLVTLFIYTYLGKINELWFGLVSYNADYLRLEGADSFLINDPGVYILRMIGIFSIVIGAWYLWRIRSKGAFLVVWLGATLLLVMTSNRPYSHYVLQAIAPSLLLFLLLFNSYARIIILQVYMITVALFIGLLLIYNYGQVDNITKRDQVFQPIKTPEIRQVEEQILKFQKASCEIEVWQYGVTGINLKNVKYFLPEHYILQGQSFTSNYLQQQNVCWLVVQKIYQEKIQAPLPINATILFENKEYLLYQLDWTQR